MKITIAVDAMGGDHGCRVTVPAVLAFLEQHPSIHIILVGQPEAIAQTLGNSARKYGDRLAILSATEVVGMDESPQSALKNKKQSSMRIAINQVKDGAAQACVSAGNTGALMATGRFVLKMLPGIERPAIAKVMPNIIGHSVVLDLGANIDSEASHLLQFAVMGSMLASALLHKDNPTVGLLNVGTEDIKGTPVIKEASELLKASGLNYFGYVEGNDIYKGTTDVVVCDGFTGNVALKTSEGLASMVNTFLRGAFTKNLFTKMIAVLAYPVLSDFKKSVDHRRYNGASLLGLRGTVVKSHGSADEIAFGFALQQALLEVENRVIPKTAEKMSEFQQKQESASDSVQEAI
ncbi:phosphate acyltransferase PlsX [Leeia sp. TBRC 13508]|uniref:Phosphate acyltransferase n=1 Tax=Leeia speluncae TaxID=2884804 RepID=A0ABS8D857_9NEIS|nr:phosphate acyltransferase PlsX [Leeia speluncae]MCB6184369.1 phosphate acyltransferase PlsX [Leeia speluncae]